MTRPKKIILKILLALTLSSVSIYIFAPWEYPLFYLKPLPTSIEAQLSEATEHGMDGIIVYIDEANSPKKLLASGWHNKQTNTPAYGEALFKIASIAKLYEAAAIAKLAARDELALDGTLAEYLPELRESIENADQITIEMMVKHRSGIPNFTDQDGFDWGTSSLNVLELVLNQPADFAPNTEYAYSNTNYLLLQKIMTRVLGYECTQFIKNEILKPLGLTRTFFSIHEVDQSELMSGYYVGYEGDFKHLNQGYVASAQNVGVFLRALNDGSLFTARERQIYSDIYEYQHTGWVLGYSSIARYHKDTDTVIVQFTNTTGEDRVMLAEMIYGRLVKILQRSSAN